VRLLSNLLADRERGYWTQASIFQNVGIFNKKVTNSNGGKFLVTTEQDDTAQSPHWTIERRASASRIKIFSKI
jgi:hypothetical protein